MTGLVRLFPDTYVDSVVALRSMRAMRGAPGVEWATAVMATPVNLDTLRGEAIDDPALGNASANDFCLAVRASEPDAAAEALTAGEEAAFAAQASDDRPAAHPRSVRLAAGVQAGSNVAIVSVPGSYAAVPSYQALDAGMHVLLFSDNVAVDEEVRLKQYARDRGLLVMGPGAGTAMLGGTGLGFSNVVRRGRVGVVAAAGTGAQEAMTLLDRWSDGVSQVIGLGGRDLHADVGGQMATLAIETLRDDPATDAVLLVSKPPDPNVARQVLGAAGNLPVVAALIGLDEAGFELPPGVRLARTLESGVTAMLELLGLPAPDLSVRHGPAIEVARARIHSGRTTVRGLFSGGTLCYESLVVLTDALGPVYSNTPLDPALALPAPSASHQCLDLGEEEYTRGRPHPMIDAEARIELVRQHAADPTVAAIILDVVLGHASHPDPAGALAPVCSEVMSDDGPQVVAYVLGTDADPQGLTSQRDRLVEAGCIVTETAARASLVAAALATGDPTLAQRPL